MSYHILRQTTDNSDGSIHRASPVLTQFSTEMAMSATQALSAAQAGASLWDRYSPLPGAYDELFQAPGELREHWRGLIDALALNRDGETGRRREAEVRRLLQDNGVTYNVHDDPRTAQRPWVVDPVPLPIAGPEWGTVEAGLAQRSRLLERLLADLYGPRRVLRQGILPPELVYAHPGFSRPCVNSLPVEGRWLMFHGVDLARFPDGGFRAVADKTQAPAGAGYALENRIIMARAMPELYRDAPLRRLAGFLETLRTTLQSLAPHKREQPRVVLLTPGPASRSYFEHAYLSNYLSLSLVEGADLTVRDDRVWLKTLGGLMPVDVILRRVNDELCDPLELRGDSLLGVPGLLQVVRSGGVVLANPLGSAIAENPGLLAFMPVLCRHLLGEELLMPSVRTWWCGQGADRDHVLANMETLLVRSILPGHKPVLGAQLDAAARDELTRRIRAAPHLYVGQEPTEFSSAPVLDDSGLASIPMLLRSFTALDGDGYRVMPGGLARVSKQAMDTVSLSSPGRISKDLWVLAPAPEKHISLLRQGQGPVVLTRDGADLPSRVADNLFWLGRYGERLDGMTRLLREALVRLLEQERGDSEESCLDDLLAALKLAPVPVATSPQARFKTIRAALLELLGESEEPPGMPVVFAGMLRTGRAVRDHLGDDSWRVLNHLQQRIQRTATVVSAGDAREMLEGNQTLLAAFYGLNNETMPHHLGWLFLDIGRHLERVQSTLDLLELAFVTARRSGLPLWEVVMTTTDNLAAYRRRYRSELHPRAILDLLLFDEDNPRSVGYQVTRLQTQIGRLPRPEATPYRSSEERLILQAVSALRLADIERLAALGRERQADSELARLLESLSEPLSALSEALIHTHFSHAEVPRQLLEMQV